MLAEAEDALVKAIKDSAIGQKLTVVEPLPGIDNADLVKHFAANPPAVYVAPASFPVKDGSADLKFGIACVTRHGRGFEQARKGDGKSLGLYTMLEAVAALVDGAQIGGASWGVTGVSFMADELLFKAGLEVAAIHIETTGAVTLPPALDEAALADFKTLRADYDIEPHVSGAEHAKWAGDPPDHLVSAPELSDQHTLQP